MYVCMYVCMYRVADKEVLQPSYDQLATAIRGVQSDALVFFAAVTWDDIVPAGFTAAPGTCAVLVGFLCSCASVVEYKI